MRHSTLLCAAAVLCLLPSPSVADEVGINAHIPANDELDALRDLGVGWLRIDNNWLQVEPRQGQFEWREMDRVVDGARERGLKVYMTLAYAPRWATNGGADEVHTNDVPRADAFAAYVDATVRRYRPRGVTHFGIWNEPNLEHFFEGSLQQYIDLILNPGAAAVRGACADCVVLGPDLAGVGDWQQYLAEVLERAPDAFDILAHHTYRSAPDVRPGWICDDFDHAMDIGADAICFYEPGLRQILDGANFQREVWLTETGHRGDPWDSANEQDKQVRTARHILRKQLETAWWTNTFFYELTDCRPALPDCTIDGYGILRRTSPPDDTWRDNFVVKPVYAWLEQELRDNPVWGQEPEPDPEPDPEPAPRIEAPHRDAAQPDGDLAEWDDAGCVILSRYEVSEQPRAGAADLSARACAAWSDDALWLSVDAEDEIHDNDHPAGQMWMGDSVQLALDLEGDGGEGYDDDDREFALALAEGESRIFAHHGALDGATGSVRRDGNRTRYELRVPRPNLAAGQTLKASFLLNDADGRGRDGWLEWTPGVGREKRPADFGEIALVAREAEPDPQPEPGPPADSGRPPPPVPMAPDLGPDPEPGADAGPTGGEAADPPVGGDDPAPPAGGDTPPTGGGGDINRRDIADAGTATRPSANDDDDDGGCSQRPGDLPGGAAWLLLPVLLLRRSRRRG